MEWQMIIDDVFPMVELAVDCRIDHPDLAPLVFGFLGSVLDFCTFHLVYEDHLNLFVLSTLASLFTCQRFYSKVTARVPLAKSARFGALTPCAFGVIHNINCSFMRVGFGVDWHL